MWPLQSLILVQARLRNGWQNFACQSRHTDTFLLFSLQLFIYLSRPSYFHIDRPDFFFSSYYFCLSSWTNIRVPPFTMLLEQSKGGIPLGWQGTLDLAAVWTGCRQGKVLASTGPNYESRIQAQAALVDVANVTCKNISVAASPSFATQRYRWELTAWIKLPMLTHSILYVTCNRRRNWRKMPQKVGATFWREKE